MVIFFIKKKKSNSLSYIKISVIKINKDEMYTTQNTIITLVLEYEYEYV